MVEEKKRVFDVPYIKTNNLYTHVMVSSIDGRNSATSARDLTISVLLAVNVFEY
jgi:hypothetical protein